MAAQALLPRNLGVGRETDAPEVPGPTLTALGAGAEGLVGGRRTCRVALKPLGLFEASMVEQTLEIRVGI